MLEELHRSNVSIIGDSRDSYDAMRRTLLVSVCSSPSDNCTQPPQPPSLSSTSPLYHEKCSHLLALRRTLKVIVSILLAVLYKLNYYKRTVHIMIYSRVQLTSIQDYLRSTTWECVYLVTCGHFRWRSKGGGHTIRSAVDKKRHDTCRFNGSMFNGSMFHRTGVIADRTFALRK